MNHKVTKHAHRGQILALFMVLLPALIAIVGLAIEIGNIVTIRHEAQLTLDGAAYAATQALDWNLFYTTNQVKLDPDQAAMLAGAYASMNTLSQRYKVRVVGVYTDGERVFVAGQVTYFPLFKFWGTHVWTMQGSARPAYGIEKEGQ